LQSSEFDVKIKGATRKIHPGRPSSISLLKGALTRKVFSLREQGLAVTSRQLRVEASKMCRTFKSYSLKAQYAIIHRITKKAGLSHRVSTHAAQKHFKETEATSKEFMMMAKERAMSLPPEAVMNMDQTPVMYSNQANRTTYEKRGTKSIHIRTSGNDSKCCTLNASVAMSGHKLRPMGIFKGTSSGNIAKKELPRLRKMQSGPAKRKRGAMRR
jgi:hypothetical protein